MISRWERGRVEPSLETLRRLVRACGLDLWLRFATFDDSYVGHIEQCLELSPAERLAHAEARERGYAHIRGKTLVPLA